MFGQPIIGQFMHLWDSPFSYLTFLAPQSALESPRVSALIEYMTTLSGERGALRLLADVDERTQVFEILHKCGFAIYTRQRVWQMTSTSPSGRFITTWFPPWYSRQSLFPRDLPMDWSAIRRMSY
jgi:hypothetical protein